MKKAVIFLSALVAVLALALVVVLAGNLASSDRPEEAPQDQQSGPDPNAEVKRFAGVGTKNLGVIRLKKDSVLEWRHRSTAPGGGFFIVQDEKTDINVTSQGSKGDSVIARGTYRRVQVTADGAWQITIRPT